MSKGDNLIGTETVYKGIKFKSKLEAKFAMFLDALLIKWEYEPQTFVLSNGITYIPDFYLKELKTWIEVKGDIRQHNLEISELFTRDNKTEMIIISNEEIRFFGVWANSDEIYESKDVLIGKCSKCNSFFFCEILGSYNCRRCNNHEGDHDIKYSLQCGFYGDDKIDFYDSSSIKEGLQKYGVSI